MAALRLRRGRRPSGHADVQPSGQTERADVRGLRRPPRPPGRAAQSGGRPGSRDRRDRSRILFGGGLHEIIGKLLEMDPRDLLDFTRMTGTVVQRMREAPLPIIAAVNEIAAGAGAVIALAADIRLLAASASFAFLFTKVGLAGADMGSAYLLPRLVGFGRATELLMLGEKIGARQASEIGLATSVVKDEELPARARELARRLATGPALAYAATKMLLSKELDMNLAGSIELEAMTQALLMKSADHAEFYEAFQLGRYPKWTGR